jgi:hypothetical protein
MANYTKLFNSIITSTIWTEDDKTRLVWITMLAMCDQNGEVQASVPGIARLSGVSVEDAEMAINKLLSPDKHSRTPDNEGRRIAPIEGGWELLNHAKYRRMASLADTKEATAKRVKRHRDRNANVTQCNGDVTVVSANVTPASTNVTLLSDKAEAEAEAYLLKDGQSTEKKVHTKNKITCPISSDVSEILKFIWENCPAKSRERSSKKELLAEWNKMKASERPSQETIKTALDAWNASAKWLDGYSEGIDLWVKKAQWENLPLPANSKSQPPPKKIDPYAPKPRNDEY